MSASPNQQFAGGAPRTNAFHRRAATFSIAAPLVAINITLIVEPHTQGIRWVSVAFGITCPLLILLGLILGIIALVATKRLSRQGIFGRAVAGICIAGAIILFTLLSIPDVIRQAQAKRAIYRQMMEQRP